VVAMKKITFATAILLLFLLIFLLIGQASADGYIVESGYDKPIKGDAHDPVPISFWQLPLWIMMLHITAMPIEMLASLKASMYLGYKRISGRNVLDQEVRSKIYDHIKKNPGVHYSAIADETGINSGTLRYHLKVLQMHDNVRVFHGTGYTRYFENNMKFNEYDQKVLHHIRNDTSKKILEVLIKNPNASRKDISDAVGVSGPSVSWYMKQLCADDVVSTRKEGRHARYCLNSEVVATLASMVDPQVMVRSAKPCEHQLCDDFATDDTLAQTCGYPNK
jgi:predicted transcriptional regulator